MDRKIDIKKYSFSINDSLFFDANIWYFIYGPTDPEDKRSKAYSSALAKILTAKSKIYIDILVLSEFINRYARFHYNLAGTSDDFKQYRQSEDFVPIAKSIVDACKRILKDCARTDSCFELIDFNTLLVDYESKLCDFNDQILAEICKNKDFKFVTHDADFRVFNISILTANQRLLFS